MHASSRPTGLAIAVVIGLSLASGAASAQVPGGAPQAPPAAPQAPPTYTAPPATSPVPMAPQAAPMPYAPMPYAPYAMPGYLPPAYASGSAELSRRNSTPMMATGIALLAVGTLGAVLGSVVYSAGYDDKTYDVSSCLESDFCEPVIQRNSGVMGAGIAMIAIGTIAVAVGIPVMLVGLKKVPNTPAPNAAPSAAAFVPELSTRGNGAQLTWRF